MSTPLFYLAATSLAIGMTSFGLSACQKSSFRRDEHSSETAPLPEPITPGVAVVTLPQPIATSAPKAPAQPPAPLFEDCDKDTKRQLMAHLYTLPVGTQNLPDFSAMKATKTLCLVQLDITDRDFKEGFPGVDGLIEWFALDIRFSVNMSREGLYEFSLNSDDGSQLFIDDKIVINNDGEHSAIVKTGSINLSSGQHTFRVAYYQGPRYRLALELKWKTPGSTQTDYIPLPLMQRPAF